MLPITTRPIHPKTKITFSPSPFGPFNRPPHPKTEAVHHYMPASVGSHVETNQTSPLRDSLFDFTGAIRLGFYLRITTIPSFLRRSSKSFCLGVIVPSRCFLQSFTNNSTCRISQDVLLPPSGFLIR